jgi:hypothetical protein
MIIFPYRSVNPDGSWRHIGSALANWSDPARSLRVWSAAIFAGVEPRRI